MTPKTTSSRPQGIPTVRISNERVRVTEWKFRPNAETGHHIHETDYVVVPITSGELLIIDDGGVESIVELTAGVPYFRQAGVEHNVVNNNLTDFTFIEIELL